MYFHVFAFGEPIKRMSGSRNKTVEYLQTQHGDLVTTIQGLPNDVEDYIRSD